MNTKPEMLDAPQITAGQHVAIDTVLTTADWLVILRRISKVLAFMDSADHHASLLFVSRDSCVFSAGGKTAAQTLLDGARRLELIECTINLGPR